MNLKRLNVSLPAAFLLLAATAAAYAQSWETILPDPQWPEGNLSGRSGAGGRALLFSPAAQPLNVYLSTIDYNNGPTLWALSPDEPGFPLNPAPTVLDSEPLGGCAWIPQLLDLGNSGMWEIGRYTYRTAKTTTYYWRVRTSPPGQPASWTTVDNYIPSNLARGSIGEANPHGIAASPSHLLVSGMAYDGSTWRWVVRRAPLEGQFKFENVLDIPTAGRVRSRICYYGGVGGYSPAVLTIGKTPLVSTGKRSSASLWSVRRSLDGGASFTEQSTWSPSVLAGAQAVPVDIACDPSTGWIYVVGGLASATETSLPSSGWVIRVNKAGGAPDAWETLLETTVGRGTAQRIAFGPNGTVYVAGHFVDPSTSKAYMAAIRNAPNQSWTESLATATYPFGTAACNTTAGDLAFGPDGKLYITGDVSDYSDATGAFPGLWTALARTAVQP